MLDPNQKLILDALSETDFRTVGTIAKLVGLRADAAIDRITRSCNQLVEHGHAVRSGAVSSPAWRRSTAMAA
jgi:hypothetical protein